MRRVHERRGEARAVGAAARRHVLEQYSQEAVAEQLIRRLRHLEPTLLRVRESHMAKRRLAEARQAKAVARVHARRRALQAGNAFDDWEGTEPAKKRRTMTRERQGRGVEGAATTWAATWAWREEEDGGRAMDDVPRRAPHAHTHRPYVPTLDGAQQAPRAEAAQPPARSARRRLFVLARGLSALSVPLQCQEGGQCCQGDLLRYPHRVRVGYALLGARDGRALSPQHLRELQLSLIDDGPKAVARTHELLPIPPLPLLRAHSTAGAAAATASVGVAAAQPVPMTLWSPTDGPRDARRDARRVAWLLTPLHQNLSATRLTLCRRGGSRLTLSALEIHILAVDRVVLK